MPRSAKKKTVKKKSTRRRTPNNKAAAYAAAFGAGPAKVEAARQTDAVDAAPYAAACPPPFPSPREVVENFSEGQRDELLKRLQVAAYRDRHTRTVTPLAMSELVTLSVERDAKYAAACNESVHLSILFFNEEGEAGYNLMRQRFIAVANTKAAYMLDTMWRSYCGLKTGMNGSCGPAQCNRY